MSPEVIARKLAFLQTCREDLSAYAAAGTVQENHYAVERLVQLIVECMCDIISRWLAIRGVQHPDAYAELFQEAAGRKLLPGLLAERLVKAARMRNLLVHIYERIDVGIVCEAVPQLLKDASEFITCVESGLSGAA